VLAFTRAEITLVFMTILIATFVARGGKTHWYKGVQLLTVYLFDPLLPLTGEVNCVAGHSYSL
jgi:Ca2+/H+ antiporter